jgi:polyphosphate kinase
VAELFNYLTGFGRPHRFRKLLVAPFHLRERLTEKIGEVGEAAAAGTEARIRIKVNNLADPEVIEALYSASQQGATIELICRSICTLRPGVAGMSENIHVRSILGRFLEHSRMFIFEIGDEAQYFLGSADLMPRNLDHRIETVFPVEESRAQVDLRRAFDMLMSDSSHAWELRSDGKWQRVRARKGERPKATQEALMRNVKVRRRRRAAAGRTA